MSIPIEEVLRTLRLFPAGATTAELATRLGMRRASLGNRLSKQFLWGRNTVSREVQRVPARGGTLSAYDQFIWRTI